MVISLIGYRATGKSTVARSVADALGWNWIDADSVIEDRAGQSIAEIFATVGEVGFRRLEAEVIAELVETERTVIAMGGGAILRDENCRAMRRAGPVVWLRADPVTLASRIDKDPQTVDRRPRLTSEGGLKEVTQLLKDRTPKYRAAADIEVDTDQKRPSVIAEEIVARLAQRLPND